MVDVSRLDEHSDIPMYRQVYQQLRESIESGKLPPGSRLPGTRELAGMVGLSRTTILGAYSQLESEGWIASQSARGSYVKNRAVERETGLDWKKLVEVPPEPRPQSVKVQISFAHSRPAAELFPVEEFASACRSVLNGADLTSILQLGSPGGYEPLRQAVKGWMREEGTAGERDDVLITSGCQQALDLVRRVLVKPGDRVLLEDPIYPGIRNLMAESGAELVGIPLTHDGLDLGALERELRIGAKLLVVTPSFQNPTGLTMPVETRKEVLRLARLMRTVVVENDSYGRLRYRGDELPTLKELDPYGDVVLLRSFSKLSFPGLRIGWASAPKPLIQAMTEAKHRSDLHSDQFSQAVMLQFVQEGRMVDHKQTVIEAGRLRLQAALDACRKFLPEGSRFTEPDGGMNLWITLPAPLDAGELLSRAEREGVTYLPGRNFRVTADHPRGLRLSFAGVRPEEIEQGLAILGRVFGHEMADRGRGQKDPSPAMV